jgi:hypothetical protein
MRKEKGTKMQQNEEPTLRKTALEVQRAHDLLGALLKSIVSTPGETVTALRIRTV